MVAPDPKLGENISVAVSENLGARQYWYRLNNGRVVGTCRGPDICNRETVELVFGFALPVFGTISTQEMTACYGYVIAA
jgi:hypothetical protein